MSKIAPADYFQLVRRTFQEHGSPEVAQFQMHYLRDKFEFFGLKMPAWTALARTLHRENGVPQGEALAALAQLCFADDHRELHYFALETVQKALPKEAAEAIELLETLICSQSWWDSVDWLAKLVGMHFVRFPELLRPVTERWMDSGNIWLRRVCLLFQLRYREKTDAVLLFDYVRRLAKSEEFFLQKGAGWALREYSKTNPEAVRHFILTEKLAPLTKREGLKLVGRG